MPGTDSTPDVSFILCCYNEEERIREALEQVLVFIDGVEEDTEVLVIDNGSEDKTREIIATFSHPNLQVILNETNLGKGGSIRKGIDLARGKHIVIQDPDLEYLVEDSWEVYLKVVKEKAQMGLGTRVSPGATRFIYLQNYLGVLFLTQTINILFGTKITDSATATKVMESNLIKTLRLDASGFNLDFQLITRIARGGGTVVEHPVRYFPRTVAQGKKIRPVKDGLASLIAILRDRILPASQIHRLESFSSTSPKESVS